MYNWKKRLLAAVLAGCMTVGLMAPALATVGGEDTLTTAGEVDPGFSVDPVYPVEPTDPVEPVEPTPPVETEIPDGEIPLDPGFNVPDYANMSTEELYEVVKDLSDEDRAIVYSLLTEEQIAALEAYIQAQVPVEDYGDLYEQLMSAQTVEEALALVEGMSEEEQMNFAASLTQEQFDALMAHLDELPWEEDPEISDEVQSAENFDNVATFDQGKVPQRRPMMMSPSNGTRGNGESNGLELSKSVIANGDGTYTLKLESYTTGNVVAGEAQPCDIILVLDQSSSMQNDFGYTAVEGTLDKSSTYYVYTGRKYEKVTYCSKCQAWTNGCWSVLGYHNEGTKYTPIQEGGREQFYIYLSRLDALKQAASAFVTQVADKGGDHRIGIVGFGNDGNILTSGWGETESLWVAKDRKDDLLSIIKNLRANANATEHGAGLESAESIFDSYSSEADRKRQRVVILFTDGEPAPSGSNDWSSSIVQGAIESSYRLKNEDGAVVYSISVMPGTDAAGNSAMDRYMRYVSSDYPEARYEGWATSSRDPDTIVGEIVPGTPAEVGDSSFYLTAGDIETLEEIFEKIGDQTGGAAVEVGTSAVVKDGIAPYFQLPEGAANQVVVYTEKAVYEGADLKWEKDETYSFQPTISVSGEPGEEYVSVSGFDYTHNFVAETGRTEGDVSKPGDFHGRRMVVEIPITPRAGFLGGNAVPTNTADSGLYENGESTQALGTFVSPEVNVPIQTLDLSKNNVNIYYGNDAPAPEDLVSWGGTPLSQLESWQTAYVNVTATVTDTMISNTADGNYNVAVTVTPTDEACGIGTPAVEQTGSAQGTVNVFKLHVTYQDTTVQQGDTPDYALNQVGEKVWKHNEITAGQVLMMGNEPALDFAYSPEAEPVTGTDDINVTVTVTKGGNPYNGVVFGWIPNPAEGQCGCTAGPVGAQFRIHVFVPEFTFTLAKKLTTAADGEQTFVFHIVGGEGVDMTVALTIPDDGNYASKQITLPSGTYTVTEDSDWSWKYEKNNQSFEVTKDGDTAEFTNTRNDKNWLGGSHSVENHFAAVNSGSSDQTIDTLDALVPPLPTGEKKQENEDDQKKTEPDPGEDPDLDSMTQEGGVDHV